MPNSTISIAECHQGRIVIEESVPFAGDTLFITGAYLQSIDRLHRFTPMRRTALVEYFRLENVIFDGQTGAVFKNGIHVAESRYSAPLSHDFMIDPTRVVKPSAKQPIFIGYHAWHNNYFHWLTQCIPSMYWACKLWVDSPVVLALPSLNGWQEQTLLFAGLSQQERLTIDHQRQYQVDNVAYTTFTQGVSTYRPSGAAVEVFRRMRSQGRTSKDPANSVIYVSRADCGDRRRMVNEAELCALLQAEGIDIVVPSRHSIEDQIAIFSRAKAVIGPHGAGLTNMIFCEPGTLVYELMSSRNPNPCFANLAFSLGMHYRADGFPYLERNDEDWVVDLQEVLTTVRGLMKMPSTKCG